MYFEPHQLFSFVKHYENQHKKNNFHYHENKHNLSKLRNAFKEGSL